MPSLTLPNPFSKLQLGPHLLPDCVCLQELHSRSDQLRFVSLRGVVQSRVAQSGLGIKAVETAVIPGLKKQQLPWYNAKKKQRADEQLRGAKPQNGSCNRYLLKSFRISGNSPLSSREEGSWGTVSSCPSLFPITLSSPFSSSPSDTDSL